jgi:hypothetical protein
MSSRALRKAQRQQEEQKAIQTSNDISQPQSEEEKEEPAPVAKKSAFALLSEENEDEDQNEQSDADDEPPATPALVEVTHSKAGKKKKKKKKAKAAETVKDEEDDIDIALRSLAKAKSAGKERPTNTKEVEDLALDPETEGMCRLLSIESQYLHVRNEMRQLFGRETIEADRRPAQQARQRRQRGAPQAAGQGFPALSLRRNIFISGKEEWPRATTGGLGMEIVVDGGEHGISEYRFIHSTAYQDAQRQYEIAVASMDPNRLAVLMQQNPYHIATVLQISEITKHEGSHADSGDFIERALFSFGRAVNSTFAHKLSQGKARLNFNRPENREFFLAIWRYIQNLTMRSTWRTVYEWAKLLLSLDPSGDPYCIELALDQYSLRARQPQNYLDILHTKYFEKHWRAEHIPWSASLAYLQTEKPEKAREELLLAIESQPWLCVRLYKELDLDPIPPALWSFHESPTPMLALFVELYITRGKELWNTPEAKSLLVSVAPMAKPVTDTPEPRSITVAEARHIHLTQNDTFVRLLAPCAPELPLGRSPNTDPFPPQDNIISYDPIPGIHGADTYFPPNVLAPGMQLPPRLQELLRNPRAGQLEGLPQGDDLRQLVEEIQRLGIMPGADHDEDDDDDDIEEDSHGWVGGDYDSEEDHSDAAATRRQG